MLNTSNDYPHNPSRFFDEYSLPNPSQIDPYDIQWAKQRVAQSEIVASANRLVHAPANVVWSLIKDLPEYESMSHGLIKASAEVLKPGSTVQLNIQLGGVWNLFRHSKEMIFPFDEKLKVLGWVKRVRQGSAETSYKEGADIWKQYHSRRIQFVEAIDANTCRYYSALRIPGFAGKFTMRFLNQRIQKAFDALADGLVAQAESHNGPI